MGIRWEEKKKKCWSLFSLSHSLNRSGWILNETKVVWKYSAFPIKRGILAKVKCFGVCVHWWSFLSGWHSSWVILIRKQVCSHIYWGNELNFIGLFDISSTFQPVKNYFVNILYSSTVKLFYIQYANLKAVEFIESTPIGDPWSHTSHFFPLETFFVPVQQLC